MPLLIKEKLGPDSSWALWSIKEEPESLLQGIRLSTSEHEELELLKGRQRKLEWLASRILLKELAKDHSLFDTSVIKDECGKPRFSSHDVHISISHSYPYAAAILHTKKAVGIDIEHQREQLRRVKHKFLNQDELNCAENKIPELCVYWTAKEALYKLWGRRGLMLKDQIHIEPFELGDTGQLNATLYLNKEKRCYTLHYRQFKGILVCFSL